MKSSTPMSSCLLIALIISTPNLALIFSSSNGAAEDWQFLCSLIIFAFLMCCLSVAALSSNSSRLTSPLSSVISLLSVSSSAEYPHRLAIFWITSTILSFSIFNASIFDAIAATWVVKFLNWANMDGFSRGVVDQNEFGS